MVNVVMVVVDASWVVDAFFFLFFFLNFYFLVIADFRWRRDRWRSHLHQPSTEMEISSPMETRPDLH
ncbi:hypothetical protein ACOSQ3_018742 [Xanthoceras sorbifolium]